MIISSASTVKHGADFPDWVVLAAPPIIFALVGIILWAVCAVPGRLCVW
jgi:multiple antibiotic resistance protein